MKNILLYKKDKVDWVPYYGFKSNLIQRIFNQRYLVRGLNTIWTMDLDQIIIILIIGTVLMERVQLQV